MPTSNDNQKTPTVQRYYDPAEAARQKELAIMHASKKRPICHCRNPGIEMYIAKIEDHYIVKRMPETGGLHSPTCDSYEPPAELSGLGEVLGTAIKENLDGLEGGGSFAFILKKRKPCEDSRGFFVGNPLVLSPPC